VRCLQCRVQLHTSLDERTMDTPADPTKHGETHVSWAESAAQAAAMV
jgi:hypothetical protein